MSHAYLDITLHIVFSTKNHEPLIDSTLAPEIWRYLAGVGKAKGAMPYIVNGVRDHVHLLVSLPANISVGELVRHLKGSSSHWVSKEFERHFAWQSGYSAFSVSRSNFEMTPRYISTQEVHHMRTSFQDELVALLERHEIDFDERHVGRGGLREIK